MSVRVKICGLTDSAGVNAAIEAGADALGFVFYEKSPRNLRINEAVELAALAPQGILKVAVMLHPDASACAEILREFSADVLQTDAGDFSYLQVPDRIERWPVIRENSVGEKERLPSRFVYEGQSSGQGDRVDWQKAASYAAQGDMILAGGLDAENVAEAIAMVRPWAVDVSSAVESSPGRKDPDKIAAFVAAARATDRKGHN